VPALVVSIQALRDGDHPEWYRMRAALWPEESAAELRDGMRTWLARHDAAVFVASRDDGSLGGFVEVGSRSYGEGCLTSPVAYVEGWYVDPDVRLKGVGRALLVAAEAWAREQGYQEIASDAVLNNLDSHRAHQRLGYQETDRVVVFRKVIEPARRGLTLQGIDHVALAVKDVNASVRWYEEVLGLRRWYQTAWGDYPAVVGAGSTALALFPVEGAAPRPPPDRDVLAMRHVAFRVDAGNFTRARAELTRRQIAVEFQHHGISQSIYFRDPNGHEIEITTYDLEA